MKKKNRVRIIPPESDYLYVTRFDNSFKRSTVRDPRGWLHLAGCLPLESEDEVFAVEREIVVSQKVADTLFGIRDRSGRVRYEQLEALARWHTREPDAILLRSCTIVLQKELEESALGLSVVLLNPVGVPERLPEEFRREWGTVSVRVRPRYVKLWELDGREFLALSRPDLLPWVTLMNTPEETLAAAASRVAASGDEELSGQFVTLGSIRYNKEDLRKLLGRPGSMFTTRLAAQTPFGQELIQEGMERGIEQGIVQGIEQGRRREAVRALRLFLRAKFPQLADRPEFERVAESPDPEAVLDRVYRAEDEAAVLRAIEPA